MFEKSTEEEPQQKKKSKGQQFCGNGARAASSSPSSSSLVPSLGERLSWGEYCSATNSNNACVSTAEGTVDLNDKGCAFNYKMASKNSGNLPGSNNGGNKAGTSGNDTFGSKVKTWFFATSMNADGGGGGNSSSSGFCKTGMCDYKAKDLRGMNVWMPQSL